MSGESHLSNLPPEMKVEIARKDERAFIKLLMNDALFYRYMIGHPGLYKQLMQHHTKKTIKDGTTTYTLFGKRHRLDGPAYEGADGTRAWYFHGMIHREDGPAYEGANGTRVWYLHGKKVKPFTV